MPDTEIVVQATKAVTETTKAPTSAEVFKIQMQMQQIKEVARCTRSNLGM